MADKRAILEEIAAKRRRAGSPDLEYGDAMSRMVGIRRALAECKAEAYSDVWRHFPVAACACLESLTRSAVRELVDADVKYLGRAVDGKLLERTPDWVWLTGVVGKDVTVGEIIGHLVKVSSFAHIDHLFSVLLDSDLKPLLAAAVNRFEARHPEPGVVPHPLIGDLEGAVRQVAECFELRHLYAHEAPSTFDPMLPGRLPRMIDEVHAFMSALATVVEDEVDPDALFTQSEMNLAAHKELEVAQGRLDSVLTSLRARISRQALNRLDSLQAAWAAYRDARLSFSLHVEDDAPVGTAWPMFWAQAEAECITEHVAALDFAMWYCWDDIERWGPPYDESPATA